MKILNVISSYYPEVTGANTQCKKIVDSLKKNYFFKVLAFSNKKSSKKKILLRFFLTIIINFFQ